MNSLVRNAAAFASLAVGAAFVRNKVVSCNTIATANADMELKTAPKTGVRWCDCLYNFRMPPRREHFVDYAKYMEAVHDYYRPTTSKYIDKPATIPKGSVRVVSESPYIIVVSGALSRSECNAVAQHFGIRSNDSESEIAAARMEWLKVMEKLSLHSRMPPVNRYCPIVYTPGYTGPVDRPQHGPMVVSTFSFLVDSENAQIDFPEVNVSVRGGLGDVLVVYNTDCASQQPLRAATPNIVNSGGGIVAQHYGPIDNRELLQRCQPIAK